MPDPVPVYFDTCLFIELLQKNNQKRLDACEALRKKAEDGELIIVTSAVAITEVNKLTDSKSLPEEQSRQILEFFENPYIAVRPADRATCELAHEFVRTHGLTNLDAIHVATAVRSRVSACYTYDDPKQKRKGLIRHSGKIGDPPLTIEKPPDPNKGTLWDEKHIAKNKADGKPAEGGHPALPLPPQPGAGSTGSDEHAPAEA